MDRGRKNYSPQEFRTMDPSFRHVMWNWERRSGHMVRDAKRIATMQSIVLALAIGGLYGLRCLLYTSDAADE